MKRWLCATVLLLSTAMAFDAAAAAAAEATKGTAANWPGHGGTSDETAFSTLDQISTGNIGKLGLAWSLDLPDERMLEATPLAVDGVLYFTGSYGKTYAVDAASGRQLWAYDPEVWNHGSRFAFALPCNRGAAYENGKVFVGLLDGRLIALDAKTGKLLWATDTVAPESMQTITGAPRVFKGKVIIGNGGADFGARGYVSAYDAATGKQLWRFYVAPGSPDENRGDPAMEKAAATWTGEFWKKGTGGGPWDSMSFDADLNRIYVGTANAAPYDPEERSPGTGDNLFTASIVALDAETGKYVWHYQVNPRDSWDFDSTQQLTLADLVIDGKPRKVLMQSPKNGFFYVLDRTTGKLISAAKVGKANWAERIDTATGRPVENENIRYQKGATVIYPGPTGAHNWQTMSFSAQTGLMYIPYMQFGERFEKGSGFFGGPSMSVVEKDPDDGKGALVAWDPVQQKARWTAKHPYMWNGGALSTAGGLVFQGTADGSFTAYDAKDGRQLWQFNAGLGIISAPITYTAGNRQYVSVLVGYGASNSLGGDMMNVGWKYGAQPRRLLTFAIDGKVTLPPSAPPDKTVHPVDDPKLQINAADAVAGGLLFNTRCMGCHGLNAISAGAPAPDLRESQITLDRDSLWGIVHDGALVTRGMPKFTDYTVDQVRQMHAYIRAQARVALKEAKAAGQPAAK